jgi:DNA-binding CsgD family transcriptional regulator
MHSKHRLLVDAVILVGLGCFYSWFFLALRILFLSAQDGALLFVGRVAMDIAIIASFAMALIFSRYMFPVNKRFQPSFLPLALAGMLLVAYNDHLGAAGPLLCVMGTIFIGLEYGWLTMLWAELFGLLEAPRYIYQLTASILVAAGIIIATSFLPFAVFAILAAALPVLSTLALPLCYWLLENTSDRFSAKMKRFKKTPGHFSLGALRKSPGLLNLLTKAAVTFSVYGFVFSFVSVIGSGNFEYSTMFEGAMRAIGFLGAGILLLAALMLRRDRLVLSHLYWVLQPIFIAGLLFVTVSFPIGEALISMSYMLTMVLCTLTVCEIGRRFETPVFHLAAFVFGIGTMACCIGIAAGFLFVKVLPSEIMGVPYVIWALIIGLAVFTAVTSRHGGFTFNISRATSSVEAGHAPAKAGYIDQRETEYPCDLETCSTLYYEALTQRSILLGERYGLTTREVEILGLLARNLPTDNIADSLKLSPNTVKVHVHNILEKLGARRRSDLPEIIQSR